MVFFRSVNFLGRVLCQTYTCFFPPTSFLSVPPLPPSDELNLSFLFIALILECSLFATIHLSSIFASPSAPSLAVFTLLLDHPNFPTIPSSPLPVSPSFFVHFFLNFPFHPSLPHSRNPSLQGEARPSHVPHYHSHTRRNNSWTCSTLPRLLPSISRCFPPLPYFILAPFLPRFPNIFFFRSCAVPSTSPSPLTPVPASFLPALTLAPLSQSASPFSCALSAVRFTLALHLFPRSLRSFLLPSVYFFLSLFP